MPCTLSSGFARDCSDSTGGLEELYILERASVTAYTEASSEVTAITDGGSTWRKYELKKEVGSVTATTTIDPANGTRFSEGVIAFSINKFTAAKINELRIMILGQIIVICKDNNGKYWGLGFQNFAEGQSMVANSGTAYGDRNGVDIELMAKEPLAPFEVAASVVAGLTIST
tara:strand:+ start:6949 stop:7464 length:516 start_codon:yes stop_codon:yes gene_type:complete